MAIYVGITNRQLEAKISSSGKKSDLKLLRMDP